MESCKAKRLTQKKYKERPSPPYHAAECKGKTMKGNDKKSYSSVASAKGVYSWKVAATKTRKAKGFKRYITRNNGAHYWIIEDFPKEKRAILYKNNVDAETRKPVEEVQVTEIPYIQLWTPHRDSGKFGERIFDKGNTVLIQKSKETFILVGSSVTQFKIVGDEPVKYMSPIGNSDAPCPYLIGKKNVYIFVDSGDASMISKEKLDLTKDVFDQYFGINDYKDLPRLPFKKLKDTTLFNACDCRWRGSTHCSKSCPRKKAMATTT